jgi:hypothetical protein
MDRRKLSGFVERIFGSGQPPQAAPIELGQQVVFGAVEYVRGLGFEPHPDFAKCASHLGTWDGRCDIAFGRDGQPLYIQGPYDNPTRVMQTLRREPLGWSAVDLRRMSGDQESSGWPCGPQRSRKYSMILLACA